MQKINLEIKSKRYKILYDRKKHFKNVENYLKIPYKNHFIIEMWGVNPENLEAKAVKERVSYIADQLKLNRITEFSHQFTPHGSTGFLILKESHLAIHTWPELKYAHLDILTCSKKVKFTYLDDLIEELFDPQYYEIAELIY